MSKFKVGDRVVVVSDEMAFGYWLQRRGAVTEPETGLYLTVRVLFDDGATACFHRDELEFEHVYDSLSAKHAEQSSSSPAPKLVSSDDVVDHPSHYTSHPSGVECIQITEHMNFNLGNATKYVWRAGLKSDSPIEDLKKARWYIEREIQRLEGSI